VLVAALITPGEIPSLQHLVVGGELLTPEVRNRWADEVNLVNAWVLQVTIQEYGPTETTVIVLARKNFTSTDLSNIGHRLHFNVVYVFDERLRPTPLGCVGELFIGGPQVSQGYLKNPEQTAKVFVDDPFRPGCTIYATGDLVRINPIDHSSIYLDRRDTQIKIHGLRVEAGEIETVLKAASKTVSNAAVIKVEVERECLVAFMEYPMDIQTGEVKMVHDDSFGSLLMSLRHAVHQKLPSYMAPGTYVALNRFPPGHHS
jgi:acyl-coenzyme A synthetase/AMP-(fatty) acid ligase